MCTGKVQIVGVGTAVARQGSPDGDPSDGGRQISTEAVGCPDPPDPLLDSQDARSNLVFGSVCDPVVPVPSSSLPVPMLLWNVPATLFFARQSRGKSSS